MGEKLKACPTPWCDQSGGEPYVFERRHDCRGVYCPTCGVSTHPYFRTDEEAIRQWNDTPRNPAPLMSEENVERGGCRVLETTCDLTGAPTGRFRIWDQSGELIGTVDNKRLRDLVLLALSSDGDEAR